MKKLLFDCVRQLHLKATHSDLPNHLAIYFHDLAPQDWEKFRVCIRHYQSLGYRCVTLDAYLAANADDKVMFVSFDDNMREWHEALDVFAELAVPATFYINTGPIRDRATQSECRTYFARIGMPDNKQTLSCSEIRALFEAGHTIGAHTHWHHNLKQLPMDRWQDEIARPKLLLEDIIGAPVVHFSYPFGMRRYFSEDLRMYCKGAGYHSVAAGIPGRLHETPINPFNIHRTRWNFANSFARNAEDIAVDGRWFEDLTGLSAVG